MEVIEELEQFDPTWGPEAVQFWQEILKKWEIGGDGVAILRTCCDSLSRYHKASRILSEEGLIVKTDKLIRKHPACEIAKVSLVGFLSALKALDLEDEEGKGKVGNPGSFKLFQKRGRV